MSRFVVQPDPTQFYNQFRPVARSMLFQGQYLGGHYVMKFSVFDESSPIEATDARCRLMYDRVIDAAVRSVLRALCGCSCRLLQGVKRLRVRAIGAPDRIVGMTNQIAFASPFLAAQGAHPFEITRHPRMPAH
jgi:hypothetical protein